MWIIAVLALCLPLAIFTAVFQPELGGPSQALDSLQTQATVYEVRAGDTLSAIATRYGVPLSWLAISNNLTSTTIYPGQRLLIPKDGVLHTVKSGETLSSIAKAYGVAEDVIRTANGVADEPKPGTRLYIPNPNTLPGSSSSTGYRFIWPVRGTISSTFGPRIHPIYGVPSFHTGIDIAVPEGTPVRAAAAGTVSFAGWEEGFGLLVVIDHGDGYKSYYGHLSKLLTSTGQKVLAGETIALSGNTGLSTGPHLHFEVRYSDSPVDPRPLLP
ncbi:MAG: M23 family metallopeptidase [Candidatus Bipolaricaulota bacterium]|nr:M23 family metallopeptidase [Candidatus Bipolaricaulota bacterium]MDW8126208.1 M23 family metallopeptidase [Candidatus Bipolaricaulota bacterium]